MRIRNINKRKVRNTASIFTVFVVTFTILPSKVYAYLDPGSGSYVIQILIASLAAVGFFVKTYWNQIKGFFNKKDKAPEKNGDEQG